MPSPRTGTIYSWKVEDIIQQRIMPRSRFPVLWEFKLRSISKTGDKDKFFVSMLKDGKIQLAEYSLADFQARNFANPLRCFTADDRVLLPSADHHSLPEGETDTHQWCKVRPLGYP